MNLIARSLYIKIKEKKSLFVINTNKVSDLTEQFELMGVETTVSDTQKLAGINLKLKSDLKLSYKPHFMQRFSKLRDSCNKIMSIKGINK